MIVKIGNQSFDSRQVPIAIVMDDQDLIQIGSIPLKGDAPGRPSSLYLRCPVDVPLETLRHWLREAAPELDLTKLAPKLFNPGEPRDQNHP